MCDMGVGSLSDPRQLKSFHRIITDRDIVIKAVAEGKDLSARTAGEASRRVTRPSRC